MSEARASAPASATDITPVGSGRGLSVAVIGSGSIGISFALVFARAGFSVRINDSDPERAAAVHEELQFKLTQLDTAGLLLEPVGRIQSRVGVLPSLSEAVAGVDLVQECIPEQLSLKRELFARLLDLVDGECPLASSSSAITASRLTAPAEASGTGTDWPGRSDSQASLTERAEQILVAHPGNPPHLIPVIELVPSPNTSELVLERARLLYEAAGLTPVVVRREAEGFAFNRLQGAVLREAYALVRDGVVSVADIDRVMSDGLGRRWSFMGPFETVDLNTRGGIESHAAKMGPAYERMGAERGQHDPWTPELVAEVTAQRRELLPLEEWDNRVAWRDQRLIDDLVARASRTRQ